MAAQYKHPLFGVWKWMIARCRSTTPRLYPHYAGRGITVCDRWLNSLDAFAADMGERPAGTELDRIDNDDGYRPGNCRWATRRQQMRNRRVNVKVSIEGADYLAIELSEISGLKTDTIVARAKAGLSLQQVLDRGRRVFTPGLKLGGMASGAKKRAKTHCSKGHAFTEANTCVTKEGWRTCRRCHADRENNRRKRRAALAPQLVS